MLQSIMSLRALLCISSLFLLSEAQFFDTGASSLGSAPVGFVSNHGAFGDEEDAASLGGAQVGTYQRRQYPVQPLYQVPIMPYIEEYRPVKPICRLPGPCDPRPPVVVRPVVRPPVKTVCKLPGQCGRPVVKPVKHVCRLPGQCGGQVKPVRPARPQVKPVVRPPVKPAVRPPKRPVPPKRPRYDSKPEDIEGRNLLSILSPIFKF